MLNIIDLTNTLEEQPSITIAEDKEDTESIDFFEITFDRESRWSRSALYRIDEWSDCELDESSNSNDKSNTIRGSARTNSLEMPGMDSNERTRRDTTGNATGNQMHFDDQCSVSSSVLDMDHNVAVTSRCERFRKCSLIPVRFLILGSLLCLICAALVIGLSYGVASGDSGQESSVGESPAPILHEGQRYVLEPQPFRQLAGEISDLGQHVDSSSSSAVLHSQPVVRTSRQTSNRNRANSTSNSTSSLGQNQTTGTLNDRSNQIIPANENGQSSSKRSGRNRSTKKQLPADAASKNPISLLNEMRLDAKFNITHCSLDRKGSSVQSFVAYVELTLPTRNATYGPAYGRNKKEAKRRVAEMACKALYNLDYTSRNNGSSTARLDPHEATHIQVCTSIPS